ncbi:Nuf2 family-domain-containing protein [Zychaea mexicana]|uniref:Nuf2 family-domain-containing protein n=1 Tax=Zychaea mexicana TaxID=64656 RepID=UPI0022FE5527|nr:Nuf2 family-domain-containing protein [Zychaea mexicana]KAI9492075.1 Nuf2 family-domain-containing protein [Zychaea mexicana]
MQRSHYSTFFNSHELTESEHNLPTLSTAELVHCFKTMEISVTERHLLHPTPEGTQEIFRTIVSLVKSWRTEHVPSNFGDNTTIAGINGVWLLYFEVQSLLASLKYKDFNTSDLLAPTPHRLARIFSALANFAMFREGRWAAYENPASAVEEVLLNEGNWSEQEKQLEEEIEQYRSREEHEKMQVKQLESDNAEYEQELRNISAEGDQLKAEQVKLRETRKQLRDSMHDVQYQLLAANEAITSFRSKARDPLQTKANIAKLQETIDKVESKIAVAQTNLNLIAERAEYAEECEQVLNKSAQLPHEIQRLRNECSWTQGSLKNTEGDFEKLTLTSNELQEAEQKLHQLEEELNSSVRQLEEQKEKTFESRHQSFLKNAQDVEQAQKEAADLKARLGELKASIAHMEQELIDIAQKSDATCEAIRAGLLELRSAFKGLLDGTIDACKQGTSPF